MFALILFVAQALAGIIEILDVGQGDSILIQSPKEVSSSMVVLDEVTMSLMSCSPATSLKSTS